MMHIYSIRVTENQIRLHYRDFQTRGESFTYHKNEGRIADLVATLMSKVPLEMLIEPDCVFFFVAPRWDRVTAYTHWGNWCSINDADLFSHRRVTNSGRSFSNYEIEYYEHWRKEVLTH